MPKFSHLHVHTQYSLLDGAAPISSLYKKAVKDGMPAIAITDHGNMFGAFQFVAEAGKHRNDDGSLKVKPIVGCEFYVVEDRHQKTFTKERKDKRYHQLFLAKNEEGYRNLSKLCSLGYVEGLYSKWPRIDKELILKYHKGLIATTCCLGAEVPQTIMSKGETEAEKVFKWWLDIFGDDYYIEMQRHDLHEQNIVNEVLLKFAAKYGTKIIASNDSHYVDEEDAEAHDILLCVNTNDFKATPIATDEESGKGYRFGFPNNQFFFKTQDEMLRLFSDIPEAIDNTNEIVDKVDLLNLKKDILLPNFPIPEGFNDQHDYLEHITWEGAKQRYSEITSDIEERLKFELFTIKTMGFSGYFLIVSDFIKAGRDMGVFVGPGRGSAAGSAVAYCIGITNIDPVKYDLLFERFLNPERKSMPDIDTDFDDEGRQKVIDYVVEKYGKNQVAQIVTYGTMAAKMSIKDVARALQLPLIEANELAKLVPEKPGIKLQRVLKAPLKSSDDSLEQKEGLTPEMLADVEKLRMVYHDKGVRGEVLRQAEKLEGSVRSTGVHAAGIIIAPSDLLDIIPVAVSKDSDLLLTQFEGNIIEDAGVIKMDFLGLKTLSIIRDALIMIKENHGVDIDIDHIPLDDALTFELYKRGETTATFQFESLGMQKYLRDLKPDKFDDLIAMNALYRPGPLEYIPSFIKRKHGLEEITYDLPEMEHYLKDTYGITVYQEQVMLLSQKLAGFSKGQADTLRKAMGKKQKAVLDKMKPEFIEGCEKNGHPRKICEKIWTDWEAFASYAFNKSHSTCYAFVAYQTCYLKAHYPQEYMASVLTHSMNNLEKLTLFMKECHRMGITVLGPDINESEQHFTVNTKSQIRFGLGGIKGVGENAVNSIIAERESNGAFLSIFEFAQRNNLRTINKKTFEGLALAGAFDALMDGNRAVFFHESQADKGTFIDLLIRFGNAAQQAKDSAQQSLFGEGSDAAIPEPEIPKVVDWPELIRLQKEKEVVGIYLTGHPLDEYEYELKRYVTHKVSDVDELLNEKKGAVITIAGIISEARLNQVNKRNELYGKFSMSDYFGSCEFYLSGELYLRLKDFLVVGNMVSAKVQIRPRFRDSDQFSAEIVELRLLSNHRKSINNIKLLIDLENLTDVDIKEVFDVLEDSKGELKVVLSFNVSDNSLKGIQMTSTVYKVNLSRNLIERLERATGYRPELN
ncbi:MAG: DNA polymerase III subunit alpha [Flavobacteriales bacterium]